MTSGRPLDATDKEMYKKVRDLVYSDREIHVEEIVQALGISHGCVSFILHDRLGMGRLTARWGPNRTVLAMSKWQPEHQYAVPC